MRLLWTKGTRWPLRARLGDDAAAPRLIATVRGAGYKFTGRPA